MAPRYTTPKDFKQALEDRLKLRAQARGEDLIWVRQLVTELEGCHHR
jgi:hypothetical protein